MVDTVELMASFDPKVQMQLFQIQEKIDRHCQRRQTALELENYRSDNASMLANQEHRNKLSEIQYHADRDDQRAAMQGQTAAALANKNHENQLELMQVELQNNIALVEFNTGLSFITTLMEEDGKVRSSMLSRMENSHKVRDEIFKMQAGAVIQERLAQKQHKRDLEKMQLASSLKQSEQLFQSICLRLSKLLDDSQDDQVEKEIAQLLEIWAKEENKDS